MVDIHCHLLPCVDDGAKSWEIAEEMCRIAIQDGIQHIVCTPHANDEYAYDRKMHMATLLELQARAGMQLHLSLGCDFHFSFDNIQACIKDPDGFVIHGTDYLLVEFSDYSISPALGDALARMIAMGITPVITHPERNMILQRRPEQVLRFAQIGCAVQVTANSITGHWGDAPKKMTRWLMEHDAVHIIASDAHDTRHRPPILSLARKTVAEWFDEAMASAMVEDNPRAVIENAELPFRPTPRGV